jgi:hypothetical protein
VYGSFRSRQSDDAAAVGQCQRTGVIAIAAAFDAQARQELGSLAKELATLTLEGLGTSVRLPGAE